MSHKRLLASITWFLDAIRFRISYIPENRSPLFLGESMRLFTFLALILLAGCGGGESTTAPDMGGADGKQVAALIEDMNDSGGSPKKLEALFVKGAKPADAKQYAKFNFFCLGKPCVSGSSATCKIQVDTVAGQKAGEVEWSFEKESDKWKIKNAPLP